VEKIMNKRQVRGRDKYLVQWKGYTAEEDTWESRENLKNTSDLVKEFEKEYGREKKKKQGGKKERKRRMCSTENCQRSTQQNYYMGGRRRNTSRSIGKG